MRAAAGVLGIILSLSAVSACAFSDATSSSSPSEAATPPATVSPPSAPHGATASATASAPETSAAPSAGSQRLAWTQLAFAGSVDGVIAFDEGYVAVGTVDRAPTAWTSADGATWESHAVGYEPPEGDFPGLPGPWMGNLVEHDGWLYAIGGYQGGGDFIMPLGWRSQDGRNWEQIASQNPFYTEGYLVLDLVSGDAGLLALTRGFPERSGGVWLWTPEGSWQEVTTQMPATSAGAEFADAAWANGRYVVVGDGSEGGNGDASTWTSTDGRTWEITAEPYPWESNRDPLGVVTAVAPAPGGTWSAFLAAPGRAVALHSTDAKSWEVTQDMSGAQSGHIHVVVPIADRLLAAGGADEAFTGPWGGDEGSWILESDDGRSWHESLRTDDARAPVAYDRGGPAIASDGKSVIAFFRPHEPESSRGSVLLRAPLD